jgi:hypothetical protein
MTSWSDRVRIFSWGEPGRRMESERIERARTLYNLGTKTSFRPAPAPFWIIVMN